MTKTKIMRGFALMDAETHRQVSSKGGKASHAKGGHEWTREEARRFGRQGGLRSTGRTKKTPNA